MVARPEGLVKMTTKKTRDSELKGFLRRQKSQGGVVPSELKDGTQLLIETNRHVYQITCDIKDGKQTFVVDSTCRNSTRYRICDGIDSHCSLVKHNIADWIGYGIRMKFKFGQYTVMTSEVRGLTIKGDGFSYDMWPDLKPEDEMEN